MAVEAATDEGFQRVRLAFGVQYDHPDMRAAILLSLFAAACAPGQVGGGDEASSDDDALRESVVANLEHPEVVRLDIYQQPGQSGDGRCTGTLIGTRTLLTAAHCFEFKNQVSSIDLGILFVQPADGSPARHTTFRRVAVGTDDDFDLAVVQLESTGVAHFATPADVDTEAPGWRDSLTVYGYGSWGAACGGHDDQKRKWTVLAASPVEFSLSGPGDSGGPYFNDRTGKIAAVVKGQHWGVLEYEAKPIKYRDWIMARRAESEAGVLGD